ncbi:LysM peptidoglycan-binding domain-containing protein, partial [Evansella sp. AB-rgal1]|uniref:LysM peptidoglycan-binding domain-containing protein n=1 Tax=Evansella sp. AB-rgal1 TaxID=3242696 RepID=UPI00359E7DC8
MYLFSHHRVKENENGYDIYLYINSQEEFSSELGTRNTSQEETVRASAKSYIKEHFPNLKINAVKIMGGAILVTTLAFGPFKVSTAEASSNPSVASQQATYTVKAGDTLSHIASANNTTVNELKRINHLTSDMIRVGQTLILPMTSNVLQPVKTSSTYIVVAGDTLSGIASRHGTTVNDIRQANNLTSDLIRVGQA